jgi:hypothetical protein
MAMARDSLDDGTGRCLRNAAVANHTVPRYAPERE